VNCSRRDLAFLIPAIASAQQSKGLPSRVFKYDDLPVRVNGESKSRAVMKGETHSGFAMELHLTELGAGQAPHAPHKHVHEELLMLKDGSLDATVNGQTTRATAGSIIYVASNEMHGWSNPGPSPAQYFVIALGNDAP
jgi:quercetin dioxygenase-like cupin family protein